MKKHWWWVLSDGNFVFCCIFMSKDVCVCVMELQPPPPQTLWCIPPSTVTQSLATSQPQRHMPVAIHSDISHHFPKLWWGSASLLFIRESALRLQSPLSLCTSPMSLACMCVYVCMYVNVCVCVLGTWRLLPEERPKKLCGKQWDGWSLDKNQGIKRMGFMPSMLMKSNSFPPFPHLTWQPVM